MDAPITPESGPVRDVEQSIADNEYSSPMASPRTLRQTKRRQSVADAPSNFQRTGFAFHSSTAPLLQRSGSKRFDIQDERVSRPPVSSPRVDYTAAPRLSRGQTVAVLIKDRRGRRTVQDLEDVVETFLKAMENRTTLFGCGLERNTVKLLAPLAAIKRFRAGETVFRTGERGAKLVTVVRGKLAGSSLGHTFQSWTAGQHVGEFGLISSNTRHPMDIIAAEDSFVATLPCNKLMTFLSHQPQVDKLMTWCSETILPAFDALESTIRAHNMAARLQRNCRCRRARQDLQARKRRKYTPAAVAIQALIRRQLARGVLRERRRLWMALTIQCSYRCHLARELHHTLEASGDKLRSAALLNRRVTRARDNLLKKQLSTIPLSALNKDQKATSRAIDTEAAINRWRFKQLSRCVQHWHQYLELLRGKVIKGTNVAKTIVHGSTYTMFTVWKRRLLFYRDLVTPWRAKTGRLVCLSDEGKQFEFAWGEGKRVDGDTGSGVLVEPLLPDKTLWKVKWKLTGRKGIYMTGSLGRFHLRWAEEDVVGSPRGSITEHAPQVETQGMANLRQSLLHGGEKTAAMNITSPFGGAVTMACPRGSEWFISAQFEPRAFPTSTVVELRAAEACRHGAVQSTYGNFVSPVVDVRPLRPVRLDTGFTLHIPHRSTSTKYLSLYHWPDNRTGAERVVQGVSFDEDGCTATVENFGVYAVVNSMPSVPEVIYARLDLGAHEKRDATGKQMMTVHMGNIFSGAVVLQPKALLEGGPADIQPLEGIEWSTLPRFQVLQGVRIKQVRIAFAERNKEDCELNSWSGVLHWNGDRVRFPFEGIVQSPTGQQNHADFPLTSCTARLLDHSDRAVVSFEGPYRFGMEVRRAQLKVVVEGRDGREAEMYTRAIQGRETLRDIRGWIVKCCSGSRPSRAELMRIVSLRFKTGHGDELSFGEERIELASHHLPAIDLCRPSTLPVDESESEQDLFQALAELFDESIIRACALLPLVRTKSAPSPRPPPTPFIGTAPGSSMYAFAASAPWAMPYKASEVRLSSTWQRTCERGERRRRLQAAAEANFVSMTASVSPNMVSMAPAQWLSIACTPHPPSAASRPATAPSKQASRRVAAERSRPTSASTSKLSRFRSAMSRQDAGGTRRPVSAVASSHRSLSTNEARCSQLSYLSHSQINALKDRAAEQEHRLREALRVQIWLEPGQSAEERLDRTRRVITSPTILSNADLSAEGRVLWEQMGLDSAANFTDAPTPHRPRRLWRPVSAVRRTPRQDFEV